MPKIYTNIDTEIDTKTVGEIEDSGYRVQYAARPDYENDNLEQCPNCGNGSMPRKAGYTDHCVSCGWVMRKGQIYPLSSVGCE